MSLCVCPLYLLHVIAHCSVFEADRAVEEAIHNWQPKLYSKFRSNRFLEQGSFPLRKQYLFSGIGHPMFMEHDRILVRVDWFEHHH